MTPETLTEEAIENAVVETTEATDNPPVETETPAETETPDNQPHDRGGKNFSHDRRGGKGRDRNDRRDRGDRREKPKKEFDELLLEVRRVTRVTTGGRRMSFRATILVGNRKGKI